MNKIIDTINEHRNNNNPQICDELISLINVLNIENEKKLKEYEDNNFTPAYSNEKMSDDDIIKSLLDGFLNDTTHYDYLSVADESNLMDLYKQIQNTQTEEEKYILLIKIYSVLGWGNNLPYHTYRYIINNKLK